MEVWFEHHLSERFYTYLSFPCNEDHVYIYVRHKDTISKVTSKKVYVTTANDSSNRIHNILFTDVSYIYGAFKLVLNLRGL